MPNNITIIEWHDETGNARAYVLLVHYVSTAHEKQNTTHIEKRKKNEEYIHLNNNLNKIIKA